MIPSYDAHPLTEKELRAKILEGSQDADDYRTLAELLLESPGRENEVLGVLAKALELPLPPNERAAICAELGWFLHDQAQIDQAIAAAQTALAHLAGQAESPEVLMSRGISHATLANCFYPRNRAMCEQEGELAVDVFERLLSQYPTWEDYPVACRHAAGVYMLQQRYGHAIRLHEEAMRRDPAPRNRLDSLVWLGNALRCQGQYLEAEARLKDALELVNVDRRYLTRIYYELGKVRCAANRPDEALVAFKEAVEIAESQSTSRGYRSMLAEMRWEIGNIHYEAERYSEAISAFVSGLPDLIDTFPHLYSNTILALGHSYVLVGQPTKARDCYEELLASEQASREEKAIAQQALSHLPPLPPPRLH